MAVVVVVVALFLGVGCGGSTERSGTAICRDAFNNAYAAEKADLKAGRSPGNWSGEHRNAWNSTLTNCANSEDWVAVADYWSVKDPSFLSALSPYFRAKLLKNECEHLEGVVGNPPACRTPDGAWIPEPTITYADCLLIDAKPSDAKYKECLDLKTKEAIQRGS